MGCGSDGGRKLRQAFRNKYPGIPCGSAGKESARNAGDLGSIPGLGRSSGEGKVYPLQYSGEFHELYSPWVCKELNITERFNGDNCQK